MTTLPSEIYEMCLDHHADVKAHDFVVEQSLPVPFFGDIKEYFRSPLRVVTAALNPSDAEFPTNEMRFNTTLADVEELEVQLCRYFKVNPYRNWFNSFEPVLNGLDASFGGLMSTAPSESTAVHVDICSPIATKPTWSKLSRTQRARLSPTGREIFERLLEALNPDLVIASLSWSHVESWDENFRAARNWPTIVSYEKAATGMQLKKPLVVQLGEFKLRRGTSVLWANGSAANTPFGKFKYFRKREVGEVLLRRVRSHLRNSTTLFAS